MPLSLSVSAAVRPEMPAPTMAIRGAGTPSAGANRNPGAKAPIAAAPAAPLRKSRRGELERAANAEFRRRDTQALGGFMLTRETPESAQQRGPCH